MLDTSGLICPLPVLKARKALQELALGDVLSVVATDPSSMKDFPAFCQEAGHALITAEDRGDQYYFEIRKGG